MFIKCFSSGELAKKHGRTHFPQNEWMVFNITTGRVVHKHDPFANIADEASQHLQRFADTDMWRQRFADRAAQDVIARQRRSRCTEIARRQRRTQMERFAQYLEDDDRLDLALEKVNWQQEGF